MKIDYEYIKKLEEDTMLELTKEEKERLINAGDGILDTLQKVMDVNTEGVEEMDYPFDVCIEDLREDSEWTTVPKSEIIKNAPCVQGDYIAIKKVVN